jgi:nucleoside-diphosphate-sugar epimerase
MACWGAARVAKVRRLIYAASSSVYDNAPNLLEAPKQNPLPCKTQSENLLIEVPHAASNDMATVVVWVLSKGGNPCCESES